MKSAKQKLFGLLAALGMAALVLDTQTALQCAIEAIDLCIKVLIPSLFPFFICSNILISSISTGFKITRPLCRLLKIPYGAEAILVVGLLGGYPAGAQAIAASCASGSLAPSTGRRMLAFCSNAGPAFFFGIGMQVLKDLRLCALCWIIHICSAFIVALLTPGKTDMRNISIRSTPISLTQALHKGIRTMATVCGWILLMQIIMGFLNQWVLWILPEIARDIICGILELSTGCCNLIGNDSIGISVVLLSTYTAFGGICVWLQTLSVTECCVDLGLYLPGKITQTAISVILAWVIQSYFDSSLPIWIPAICTIWIITYALFIIKRKIAVEIQEKVLYNQSKATGGII